MSYIKHLAVSRLSRASSHIKNNFNMTGKRFEMPDLSYTTSVLDIIVGNDSKHRHFLRLNYKQVYNENYQKIIKSIFYGSIFKSICIMR